MPTRVVTISHVSGGLRDSVGRAVADRPGFQRFYKIRQEIATHYDVVLDTDTLDVDETADIIVGAARRRK